jgi:hypothetical protein
MGYKVVGNMTVTHEFLDPEWEEPADTTALGFQDHVEPAFMHDTAGTQQPDCSSQGNGIHMHVGQFWDSWFEEEAEENRSTSPEHDDGTGVRNSSEDDSFAENDANAGEQDHDEPDRRQSGSTFEQYLRATGHDIAEDTDCERILCLMVGQANLDSLAFGSGVGNDILSHRVDWDNSTTEFDNSDSRPGLTLANANIHLLVPPPLWSEDEASLSMATVWLDWTPDNLLSVDLRAVSTTGEIVNVTRSIRDAWRCQDLETLQGPYLSAQGWLDLEDAVGLIFQQESFGASFVDEITALVNGLKNPTNTTLAIDAASSEVKYAYTSARQLEVQEASVYYSASIQPNNDHASATISLGMVTLSTTEAMLRYTSAPVARWTFHTQGIVSGAGDRVLFGILEVGFDEKAGMSYSLSIPQQESFSGIAQILTLPPLTTHLDVAGSSGLFGSGENPSFPDVNNSKIELCREVDSDEPCCFRVVRVETQIREFEPETLCLPEFMLSDLVGNARADVEILHPGNDEESTVKVFIQFDLELDKTGKTNQPIQATLSACILERDQKQTCVLSLFPSRHLVSLAHLADQLSLKSLQKCLFAAGTVINSHLEHVYLETFTGVCARADDGVWDFTTWEIVARIPELRLVTDHIHIQSCIITLKCTDGVVGCVAEGLLVLMGREVRVPVKIPSFLDTTSKYPQSQRGKDRRCVILTIALQYLWSFAACLHYLSSASPMP